MILVHHLRGDPVYVNADLIESVEATPDTALTLIDGRRILVAEDPAEVVERFTRFRASLLTVADGIRDGSVPASDTDPGHDGDDGTVRPLSVVPDEEA